MIAIRGHMIASGFKDVEHTRIPGIWRKLETLYNLKTLDERVWRSNVTK
jgi:MRG-binding protein